MSSGYFKFDQNRCVGCQACVVACVNENGFQSDLTWRNIFTQNQAALPGIPLFHTSLACNHCEDAPCMKYCPALAYKRSNITGGVIHNADACIGCQYCVWHCPYEAPKYNPVKGIVEKCDFCESRQVDGKAPACATLCPTEALSFSFERIDKSLITPVIHVPQNPNPSLSITEFSFQKGPEMDLHLFDEEDLNVSVEKENDINLRHEWPLLSFTFIIAVLVGFTAYGAGNISAPGVKWGMISAAATGAILSTMHLGRKERMWRAVLNIRHSWLSREIFFFGLYAVALVTDFFIYDLKYWLVLIPGILTLVSVDMLYKPVQYHWKIPFHSGQSLLIAGSLTLLLFKWYVTFFALMLLRFFADVYAFYPLDKLQGSRYFIIRWILAAIALILVFTSSNLIFILAFVLLGELLDRIKFYLDLRLQKINLF